MVELEGTNTFEDNTEEHIISISAVSTGLFMFSAVLVY
jgi:hypothetical protein